MLSANALETLDEISKFEHNWNGNNAKPFSKEIIDRSIEIIDKIEVPDRIIPTGFGTIVFEYEDAAGITQAPCMALYLEIYLDKLLSWSVYKGFLSNNFSMPEKVSIEDFRALLETFWTI